MKVILFSILILFSINGFTHSVNKFVHNWKLVTESVSADFYVDIDNIKIRNGRLYYWSLTDLLEPLSTGNKDQKPSAPH